MLNTIVPKLYRKFFKSKVYDFEYFNIKVKYKVTGVKVNEGGNFSEYRFNIKVISGEKLGWRDNWIPIGKSDTNWKREVGKIIRKGFFHRELHTDIMYFGDGSSSFYNIDRITWK